MTKFNKVLMNLVQEQASTWKATNAISRRQNMHKKLLKILENQPTFTNKLLKLIMDVMNSSHASLYLSNNGSICQHCTCGEKQESQRIMKLLEYCCDTHRKTLNIRDLSVEPLINSEIPSALNSCLIIPIYLRSGSKAILCLKRESKEYSRVDQTLAKDIVHALNDYQSFIPSSRISISLEDTDAECKLLRKYSIPQDISFDFYEFFYQIKVQLGNWFKLSSCSVYVADQINEQLWTRNSISSSSLIFPHNSETLIGRTYEYGEIISLPNTKYRILSDIDVFEEKFVISLPISCEHFKDPVIGVLVCTRKDQNFSDFEAWAIEKFSENIAGILEHIFISNLPDYNVIESRSSRASLMKTPTSMFREVNKEKFTFAPECTPEVKPLNIGSKSFLSISGASQAKILHLQAVLSEVEGSQDPLAFYNKLAELSECSKAAYFTLCDFNNRLENLATRESMPANKLFKLCIEQQSTIYIEESTVLLPSGFSLPAGLVISSEDCMNTREISSIMMVPTFNKFSSMVGIMQFVNFTRRLDSTDIKFIECLGHFASLMCIDVESKNWQDIIEETRGQHSLQKWSQMLIRVANNSITKMLTRKNAVYQLVNCKDVKELLRICLDVVCTAMDCTQAELCFEQDGSICVFSKTQYEFVAIGEHEEFRRVAGKEGICREETSGEAIMYVPMKFKELTGYVKIVNKKDPVYKKYCDFKIENEETLLELCRKIGVASYAFPDTVDSTLESLSQCIKMIALQYKPYALNFVINNAAKSLVDSERASFYSYKEKEKNLTVAHQGTEHEIPKNFIVGEGKGIVSHVFQNRRSEIVLDPYSDERFDPNIDKLTGFKTQNLMCIPLVTDFEKFGAIEVLNKRNGCFERKDQLLLEKFGDVVCMVLEIMNTMNITLEERFRLLAISNSMENYILVFNEHRNLVYINKPIDKIFGVTQEQIMNLTYFAWMHGNKGIMEDLQSVFDNSALHIRKTSQKIKIKLSSHVSSINHIQNRKTINYRISHLQNFSSECFSGVILVIEDATALESIRREFSEVQKEIRILASPLGTDTKLQKCIRELQVITGHMENPDVKDTLNEIITRLKGGGLKKPKLRIEGNEYGMKTIASILDMPDSSDLQKCVSTIDLDMFVTNFESEISLEELRNWDLNTFLVENQFAYIYGMLHDFDLVSKFKINQDTLYNFISRIKEKSNQWNNPFHNFTHCFNVMHGVYMLLSSTPAGGYFNELDIYSLLIAAVCHDVDHRGKGNMFEVHSKSLIALTYHDKSVLEQHHAAVTFFTLQEPNCNIFSSLSLDKYKAVRKLIITSILGTDMSKHLLMLENMAARFKDADEKPIGSLDKDIEKLAQLIIHAGDLSHPCKSFRIYEMWSMLVCQEFTDQYRQEVKLGIPVTEFMKDLEKPRVYYANEVGFLNFVVKPLWECVSIFLSPHTDIALEGVNSNIVAMKAKLEEWKKAEGVDNKT